MKNNWRQGIVLLVVCLLTGCSEPIPPDFSVSTNSGRAPLTVEFTNLTEGGDGFQWEFGDGSESTERAPSHTYTLAGKHTVVLRVVEGGDVEDTTLAKQEITVETGPLSTITIGERRLTVTPREEYTISVDARDEFGNPVADYEATFRCADKAGRVDRLGKFTAGVEAGDYEKAITVEVTQAGVSKSASADVTIMPGEPDRVAISPEDLMLEVAQQHQFQASVFDRFDNEIHSIDVDWDAGAAGRIDADGWFTAGSTSGLFPDTIKAIAVRGDHQAMGTASVGIPLTIGPYTWPPGKNADRPASYQPKHRFCWAALNATPARDFPNPYDNIHGPVEVAYLRDLKAGGLIRLNHDDWTGHVQAVTAGKTARVTLYPEENFGGEPYLLEPGQEFELEGSSLGKVSSLKIEYQPPGDSP